MSTYYEYQDVKVKIAHRLMKMDGWKVYGYHADNSDSMTDYYDPAYWDGIAEKNGYRLVIDKQTAKEDKTETRTRYNNGNLSFADLEKIKKLEAMTTERGASAQEAETAQRKIEAIRARVEEGREEYTVFTPGHLANPPRCNWHIEKDGIIYDKGTGLLKFASVPDISGLGYSYEQGEWQKFNTMTPETWKAEYAADYMWKWPNTAEEDVKRFADSAYETAAKKYALLEKFNVLISRFNSICGGMVGNQDETYTYEEVTETQYKTELKPRETATGSITEGQCFIVKTGFNYGHEKGYVYRIHEHYTRTDGTKAYIAYRLGKGYKKERTGNAARGNSWSIYDPEKFLRWFEQSALAWCELEEVKTPYEVKKVVKRTVKAEAEKEPENATTATSETAAENDRYTVTADTDTRDNSHIYVVRLNVSLSKEEFVEERAKMKNCGGYYSRYKHGFIFKDDPTAALFADTENAENLPEDNTPAEDTAERAEMDAERAESISVEESTPEAETTAEQEKTPYTCGYHEENRNIFTMAEIADLLSGKRITQTSGEKYGKSRFHYIAQKYNNSVFLVYIMKEYGTVTGADPEQITPGVSFDYFGFIHKCRFYGTGENKEILRKFSADIAHKVLELIPDEATAEQNAAHIATYDRENIEQHYINGDFTKAAQEHFYTGEEPEISIHPDMSRTGNAEIIRYIMEPETVTAERAEDFIKVNAANIYKQYIQRNKTAEILRRIKTDRSRPEHQIKRIRDSITDEKTVKITLDNGQTVRAEAAAVKRIASFGYISSYDITAADRDKLPRNEYNRAADVTPDMIRSIEHGKRILYKVA